MKADLAVEAEEEEHEEEADGPEGRAGHESERLGVGNERQAWTCAQPLNTRPGIQPREH